MASTTTWVGGTVFATVVALAGGWMLGVSPQLDAADEADLLREGVESQNAVLATKLVELKEQYENLDQYRSELAGLEVQLPQTAQLSEYLRQVSSIAEANGAFVVSVKPGVPIAVGDAAAAAAASAPPPATTTESTEPTDTGGDAAAEGTESSDTAQPDDTSTTPAPAAPSGAAAGLSIPGFVAVPVDITLLGSVDKVASTLAQLQTGSTRLFLVTALTGAGTDAKEASEGKPATNKGDLEMTVSGYVYVVEAVEVPAPEAEEGGAATLPPSDLTKPLTGA